MDIKKYIISIENLCKKYKASNFYSLNNINLNVEQGEIFGLLGPNGAGKTTLISILCGLMKQTSGHFLIDGKLYSNGSTNIKQQIGVVPQEYALYPTLTAFENLEFFGAMYGLRGKRLKDRIISYLKLLNLESFINRKISSFSGGMIRRVNLIAGILHEPTILFLDEPTVGVDVKSKCIIIDFLKNLNKEGTTIIYTSHHLQEAQDFCQRIAIIDAGEIGVIGTPDELIKANNYATNLEDVFIFQTNKTTSDVI